MSRLFHVWWLLLIALIIGAVVVLYGMFNTAQQLSANNLYDATRSSANYARDDSSRESRDSFVINTEAFRNRLSDYNIRNIGVNSRSHTKNTMYIHYLCDTPSDNNARGNGVVKDGYVDSTEYFNSSKEPRNNNIPKYLPIRAIQVQVIPKSNNTYKKHKDKNGHIYFTHKPDDKQIIEKANGDKDLDPRKITNVNSKYVATLVIQNQNSVVNGKYMTKDDINGLRKDSNGTSDGYAGNDPIRQPTNTKRNSSDVTIPSYSGKNQENGYGGTLTTENDCQTDPNGSKCENS